MRKRSIANYAVADGYRLVSLVFASSLAAGVAIRHHEPVGDLERFWPGSLSD